MARPNRARFDIGDDRPLTAKTLVVKNIGTNRLIDPNSVENIGSSETADNCMARIGNCHKQR